MVYSCQHFCNVDERLLYHVLVARAPRAVLTSGADFGGCLTKHREGWSLACATARRSLPRGDARAEAVAATGHSGRGVRTWRQFLKSLPSSKRRPNKDEMNSVYFIPNKTGIIFEGPHKVLAFLLVVWSCEVLTSVLLHHYCQRRVSRFGFNQYVSGGVKAEIHGLVK